MKNRPKWAFLREMNRKKSKCPEYQSFAMAKDRCRNPNNSAFKYYGARGIKFLFRSFAQFLKCLGPRPEGMSIDRINNDGHYKPGNVRWATPKTQGRNKRGVKLNPQSVREIFQLYSMGVRHDGIARAYGISESAVSKVLAGKTWGPDEVDEPISVNDEEKKYIEVLSMFQECTQTRKFDYCR